MALTFNAQQIALGKALGFKDVSSQSDLDQINAFAKAHGVSNINSANDLNALLPKISTAAPTQVAPNEWRNPNDLRANAPTTTGTGIIQPSGGLPRTAANGSASSMDLNQLLMQQQASLQAQNQAFAMAQQQFGQQQAAQQAQMQQQLLAAQNAAAPPGAAPSASGWKPNDSGRTQLESLLLGTQAVTGAMQMVVA